MALVSHRKRFIFLKTSKTAGTSIEGFLERYCLPEGQYSAKHARPETVTEAGIIGARPGKQAGNPKFWSHMPARELAAAVGERVWKDYYKISAIRDPYDKVVSAFFFRARRAGEDLQSEPPEVVQSRFREFVRVSNLPIDRNKYTISGKLCVDFVIRYEHLHDDLKELSRRLDLAYDADLLPRYKSGQRPAGHAIDDLFDDEAAQIVEQTYRFEFSTFGYPLLCERFPERFRPKAISIPVRARAIRQYVRSAVKSALGAVR